MTKPDLSTQAARFKYLIEGGTLKSGGTCVKFVDGELQFFVNSERRFTFPDHVAILRYDEWTPVVEPMSDEFECEMYQSETSSVFPMGYNVYPILKKYIGKRVRIKIEEII